MIIVITKNPCHDAASIKERFWCECECEWAAQVVLIKMKDAGYGWRKCCWAGASLSVWLGEGHLDVGEGWECTRVCVHGIRTGLKWVERWESFISGLLAGGCSQETRAPVHWSHTRAHKKKNHHSDLYRDRHREDRTGSRAGSSADEKRTTVLI